MWGPANLDDATPRFTTALVKGLRSGHADRDLDGWVSLDELYRYVHDEVKRINPYQVPHKWASEIEGDIHVARRSAPVSTTADLPTPITASMASRLPWSARQSSSL